jgi:putative tryptophan/tyrosine transport system substrate-binding protein
MRRREFITLVAPAAAAWASAARAQQRRLPVIGFVDSRSVETMGNRLRGFRRGLEEGGYTEGQTVSVEYVWGRKQN